jgi:8-oxo-dGTP pyrophosphatase MutT (NUDIX family)
VTEYVLGFLLDEGRNWVLLINKKRPAWQAGRLNGIGGHIEPTDGCPKFAMQREFKEEAGGEDYEWEHYCTLSGDSWRVHCYRAFTKLLYEVGSDIIRSNTDEKVGVYRTDNLPYYVMPNLRWLIPMALSMDEDRAESFHIQEKYAA